MPGAADGTLLWFFFALPLNQCGKNLKADVFAK